MNWRKFLCLPKSHMNSLGKEMKRHVHRRDTVLDLGCGILEGNREIKCKFRLCVDIFPIYLDQIKARFPTLIGKLPDVCEQFVDKSFDVVFLIDILEHLEEEEAHWVLQDVERIARKKILIFTPLGYVEQPAHAPWDLPMNPHQEHKCGIERATLVMRGYSYRLWNASNIKGPCTCMFAVKGL